MPAFDFSLKGMKDPYNVSFEEEVGIQPAIDTQTITQPIQAQAQQSKAPAPAPTQAPAQAPTNVPTEGIQPIDERNKEDIPFEYSYKPMSGWDAAIAGLITAGLTGFAGWAATGDAGEGLLNGFAAGGLAFGDLAHKGTRAANTKALEEKGYTPVSIDEWVTTGDVSKLKKGTEDKKWQSAGGGIIYDPSTGETRATKTQSSKVSHKITEYVGGKEVTKGYDADGNLVESSEKPRNVTKSTKGAKAYVVDEDYDPATGKITEKYSDGTTRSRLAKKSEMPETAKPVDPKKDPTVARAQTQYALKVANDVLAELESGEIKTGPLDYAAGMAYRKTGPIGKESIDQYGEAAARGIERVEALRNQLLSQVKDLYGPQISQTDVVFMRAFDQLDASNDNATNARAVKTIKERIEFLENEKAKSSGGAPTATTQAPAASGGLKVGTVEDGYIYLGGDPSSQDSWAQQK